jgi:hypothetical protein
MAKTVTVQSLACLGVEMRRLQEKYFRTQDPDVLAQSQEMERQFDATVRKIIGRPTLFDLGEK